MPTHVALLRGINVGGHNTIAMADLREVVTSLGQRDVTTYIQSGNVVFSAGDGAQARDPAVLAAGLEHAISETLGVRSAVVVLTRDQLAQAVADNPFPEETEPKCLHAVLHPADLGPDAVAVVADAEQRARERGSRDQGRVVGRTVYLRTPDGLGRSVLAEQLGRSAAKKAVPGTTRNWATVTKLLRLLDA